MNPKSIHDLWEEVTTYSIGGHNLIAPSFFKRMNDGWELQSTANPALAICFMDDSFYGNPALSLRAAIAIFEVDVRPINDAIELKWAQSQYFPPHQIVWSIKDNQLISELVLYLFRYKDAHGVRQVKTMRYLISVGERITQRRINMVCEGALMTWLNYLSTKSTMDPKLALFTDFSRHSEKWREAALGCVDIFPKAEDNQPPKNKLQS